MTAEFVDCRSEDALNVVRSEFLVNRSHFRNTPSDALDADFSQGTVVETRFVEIHGDALDFSGSKIQLKDVMVQNIADKGISVGEGTQLTGRDIAIRDAYIGIAAKDLSNAQLINVQLDNCKIGLTLFQKKPEYGPASMQVEQLSQAGVREPFIVELRSSLTVEEKEIAGEHEDVAKLFYSSDDPAANVNHASHP